MTERAAFKPNKDLVVGAVILVISLIYFVGWGGTRFRELPLVWRFTFRLLPFTHVLIPLVGVGLFAKGLVRARQEMSNPEG